MDTRYIIGRHSAIVAFATALIVLAAGQASAITIYMSMNSLARLGGLTNIERGDVVAYTSADPSVVAYDIGTGTWSDSASIFFRGKDHFRKPDGTLGADENVFALHIFDDDSLLLTSSTSGRLGTGDPTKHLRDGGSKFDTRDLVRYDPDTDTPTLFLDGSLVFRTGAGVLGADAVIDATSLLPNGNLLISTRGNEVVGSNLLEVRAGDVFEYDIANDTASLYFDQDLFRTSAGVLGANADVDAAGYYDDDELVLSTNATARLGSPMLTFRDQDAVLYDMTADTATLFFHGDNFRRTSGLPGADEDLKAIHYTVLGTQQDPAIPEPLTMSLSLFSLAGLYLTLHRRRA